MLLTVHRVGQALCLSATGLICFGAVSLLPLSRITLPVAAVELADGTVAFVNPPRLTAASTTRNGVDENATYYLTLDLPAEASVGLQRVTIRLSEGRAPLLRFNLGATTAFEGTRYARGATLPLAAVTEDRDSQTVTIEFDPAVAPGRTVTLALRPNRNPHVGGVYLFEVTAYPAGERVQSYFSGYARLQFYENDRDNYPFF
ncbi:MAG TPA: DUF2808 domain-containing protein [Trichocoleus sp.]